MPQHRPKEADPKITMQSTTSVEDGSCNFCDRVISDIMKHPQSPRPQRVARLTFMGVTGELQTLRVCYKCVPGLRGDLRRLKRQLAQWACNHHQQEDATDG